MPTQPRPFLAVILSPTVWPPALPVTMGEDRGRGALEKHYRPPRISANAWIWRPGLASALTASE